MQLYKKISLFLSMGIMGIGLITFSINAPVATASVSDTASADGTTNYNTGQTVESESVTNRNNDTPDTSLPDSIPLDKANDEPSVSPSPTPIPSNDLLEEKYPEINKLVTTYMNARLECSLDAFRDIVTDTSYIDLENIQKRTEAIRSYDNIRCYTKRGINEIDLVVFYTYEMIIPTIETPAVSMDYLYVTYDDGNKPRVFFGEVGKDTLDYLNKLLDDEDVQKLINETNEKMTEAINNDEDLKSFWNRISESQKDSGA